MKVMITMVAVEMSKKIMLMFSCDANVDGIVGDLIVRNI